MIVIRFFCSLGSSNASNEAYSRVSELLNDPAFDKERQFIAECSQATDAYRFTTGEDYTHAIILNTAIPMLTIPKENVIGLSLEPVILSPAFIAYADKHIGKYFIGEQRDLPAPFILTEEGKTINFADLGKLFTE